MANISGNCLQANMAKGQSGTINKGFGSQLLVYCSHDFYGI